MESAIARNRYGRRGVQAVSEVVRMRRRGVGTVERILAGAVIAVLVAACGTGDSGSPPGDASRMQAAGIDRETPLADDPVEAAVAGMTAFGYDFYRVSSEPESNTVVSPLSIATAFAMARVGARSETADQIDDVSTYRRMASTPPSTPSLASSSPQPAHRAPHRPRPPEHPARLRRRCSASPTGCSCRRASD